MSDADRFEAERPRLLGLAYRMLGTLADAEDVVQEAWIRWAGADRADIDNPAAWLTTTTTRLALDRARTVARRRETYVGPWLPEPVVPADPATDPAQATELAESMTLGFLVVLDTLSATERAVFLLADVFGEPYAAIAAAVGRTEEACRQVASRARRKVRAARPPDVRPATEPMLVALLAAVAGGDVDQVLALVAPDVVAVTDGGADRRAARHPVLGAERVARYLLGIARRSVVTSAEFLTVNGEPAVGIGLEDGMHVLGADVVGGQVVAVRIHRNPEKLTRISGPIALR